MNANTSTLDQEDFEEDEFIQQFGDSHSVRSYDVLHEKVIILNGKLNRQNAQISQIRREMEATNILVVALCILTCVVTLALAVIGVSTI